MAPAMVKKEKQATTIALKRAAGRTVCAPHSVLFSAQTTEQALYGSFLC